jgi:hypothetical protein
MNGIVVMNREQEEIISRLYSEIRAVASRSVGKPEKIRLNPVILNKTTGLRDLYQFFLSLGKAFPDYNLSMKVINCKEQAVMVRYTITGRNEIEFMGVPPGNNDLVISGIDIFLVDKTKIVGYSCSTRQVTARSVCEATRC